MNDRISPNVKIITSSHFNDIKGLDKSSFVRIHRIDNYQIFEIQLKDKTDLEKIFDENWQWFEDNSVIEEVSITGIKENINDGKGSYRYSTNSRILSEFLTDVINELGIVDTNVEENKYLFKASSETIKQKEYYKFIKVSEYFRFMKYEKGGQHYPHYDSDYCFNDGVITKYSLVMYFNDCEDGEIVFCKDNRMNHKNTDWKRQCNEDEIILKFKPEKGKIILFSHDLCHSVLSFTGDYRKMVRGDLEFKVNN